MCETEDTCEQYLAEHARIVYALHLCRVNGDLLVNSVSALLRPPAKRLTAFRLDPVTTTTLADSSFMTNDFHFFKSLPAR
jgi:hypothetical protein